MKEYIIREGEARDLEQILRNNLAMAYETEEKILDEEKVRQGTEAILNGRVDGKYYVIESNGKILSQLMITKEWSDWRNCYFWWIQSVYTLPDERGKGYYGALYEYVVKMAKKSGACGIRLYVDRRNVKAMKVYEKYGMKKSNYEIYEIEF